MFKNRFSLAALALVAALASTPLHSAHAQVTCIQATNKVVKGKVVTQLKKVKRATKCKTGEVREAVDMSVYGDGSAGAKTFGTETLSDMNAMYTNVTVTGTLTVPSGTVIRCTGTFVNNGTINVSFGTDSNTVTPAHPGISLAPAGIGGEGTTSSDIVGGKGGIGLPESSAALLRYPGAAAGGASGGSFGRRGGGALTILCKNGITNAGTINADGQQPPSGGVFSVFPAVGGGGGGVVILASATSAILTTGSTVSAAGGAGSAPVNSVVGIVTMTSGGGGGGGIVHLLAPSITTTGANIIVSGGAGGAAGGLSSLTTSRQSGPGGGASGGNGGNGATFDNATPDSSPAGSPGSNGHIITSVVDPTPLC